MSVGVLVILCLLISGCVSLYDFEASQDYHQQVVGVIEGGTTVGQTIIPNRAPINGVTIWLSKDSTKTTSSDFVTVRLFSSPQSTEPIFATNISSASIGNNSPITINIPDDTVPVVEPIYIELSTANGSYQIYGRAEDIYPDGQAYINHSPILADCSFQLSYVYNGSSLLEDLNLWVKQAGIIIPLLFTLWLPGYSLLCVLGLSKSFSWIEQTALAIGLSLAVIPIAFLVTTTTNLHITPALLRYTVVVLCGILIIYWIKSHKEGLHQNSKDKIKRSLSNLLKQPLRSLEISSLAFIGIFGLTLFTRLAMIRDLATPAWVDAYHHALITRLIIDNGAFPQSFLPYLDIEPTIYHPGFHASLAVFLQLSRTDISSGMLLFGQILNAMVVFSTYQLTYSLTKSRSTGVFASLIAGLFTPMPAYYTSWSRYTQLAGLLILPTPFALFQKSLAIPSLKQSWRFLVPGAIAMSGLFLVHYRTLAFLLCLLIPFVCYHLLVKKQNATPSNRAVLIRFGIIAIMSMIISSPWLIPALQLSFIPRAAPLQSPEPIKLFSDFSWQYLTTALGKQSIVLAIVGLAWALINKRELAIITILWMTVLFFLANLDALKLPGGAFINNSSVTIMLFLPISLIGGYLVNQLIFHWKQFLPTILYPYAATTFAIILVIPAIIGVRLLLPILNPATILSRQADLVAINWIDNHIQDQETILN
jgi:hypothetical protein